MMTMHGLTEQDLQRWDDVRASFGWDSQVEMEDVGNDMQSVAGVDVGDIERTVSAHAVRILQHYRNAW